MRRLGALLMGFVAVAHGAQQQTTPGGAETIQRVHGVVVNAVNHAPVGRALVTSADQRMAQMTDSEGRFEFEVRLTSTRGSGTAASNQGSSYAHATIYLMARKPGFRSMENPVQLSLSDPNALDGTIQVPLIPEGIVAGRVSTPKAEPPVGVMVQLMHRQVEDGRGAWRSAQMQVTNSHGEYRFADLQAGDYKIITREWTERRGMPLPNGPTVGYPPTAYPLGTDEGSAGLVHVAAGESVQADLALRAAPYYPVEIAVTNVEMAQGVGVTVLDAAGGTGFSLGFDQRTQRVTGSLPAGNYRLLLSSYGDHPLMASANLTVDGPVRGGSLTLAPGPSMRVEVREEFTAAATESQQGGIINGSRPLGNQPPPRSVEVYLQPTGGQQRQGAGLRNGNRGLSKQAGSAELLVENIQPGSYTVRVQPHKGYVASATVNGQDVLHKPLVVAAGGGVPPLEVTLRDDYAKLTGTVARRGSGESSTNGSYTMVWCFPLGDGAAEPVQSFIDPRAGQLQSAMIPPGTYLVIASDAPRQIQNVAWREEETMKRLISKGTVVTFAPGGTASVSLTVMKGELE